MGYRVQVAPRANQHRFCHHRIALHNLTGGRVIPWRTSSLPVGIRPDPDREHRDFGNTICGQGPEIMGADPVIGRQGHLRLADIFSSRADMLPGGGCLPDDELPAIDHVHLRS